MTVSTFTKMIAASALAITTLGGCASNFKANVARFQQLPPAQGQSFVVVPEDERQAGGLEFAHYADLVAQRLTQYGYTRAPSRNAAQLVVRLDYGVDQGRERVRSTGGGFGGGFGGFGPGFGYGPWGYPGGFYGRRAYAFGFYDPFLWGPGFGGYNDVTSYTVYDSALRMRIDRAGTRQAVFEGTARAQSLSNKLTYLVPNLVDAMFADFPGNSGEEIKVTVAPEGTRTSRR